jgi:hypothetical protein
VPVWHEGTARWVKEGRLVLLGVTQEQHPDRCRLLAQWKGLSWPILHDPINVLGPSAVPLLVAIDEYGIVRDTRPRLDRFEADFLSKAFADDAKGGRPASPTPELPPGRTRPDFDALRGRAEKEGAAAWRRLGDALALWGGEGQVNAAISAYSRALKFAPGDGAIQFRLGVCYRRRYESALRQPGDFQAAVDHWGRALAGNPNQYIWRRRIQQYGPRLDKPYAFYDWVEEAERAIRARGEEPVALAVRPAGAEIARPARSFPERPPAARPPDPDGKVGRDREGLIRAEVTVVPPRVRPGQAVRVHVVLGPGAKGKAHWNNEAEPLRLWVAPPAGWRVAEQLLVAAVPRKAVSAEERAFDFEVMAPARAKGATRLPAYALYHVCDDRGGQCRFLRLDISIELTVAE